mmetsp:Transcript_55755/g.83021  ORF Transcript_55755/g.83021 Transcript_55755/m.83021 type:complete len:743 (-) Transcript_55755:151-2379(-)
MPKLKLFHFINNSKLKSPRTSASKPHHESICLEDNWIASTRFLRYLQLFDKIFSHSPDLMDKCKDWNFSAEVIEVFGTRSKHSDSKRTLTRLLQVGDSKGRNRHIIVASLMLMLLYESADGCWAVVERVRERVFRCESAQKQAYVLVVQHGAHVYEFPSEVNKENISSKKLKGAFQHIPHLISEDAAAEGVPACQNQTPASQLIALESSASKKASYEKALAKVHFMVEDYLDSHKENAFKSAFQEPARYYFHLCGNNHHRDHVNVHGLNGFLCLVRGWFGCQLPIIPMVDDEDTFKGCADIWSGLSENAWAVFCDPMNFGKDFEGIKELKPSMLTSREHGHYHAGHAFIGRNAGDMERSARKKDPKYLQYADKFAFFFTKDFLVKRMFEVLNAEGKPEYVGFKGACSELYALFKHIYGLSEDTLLEYLYDEYIMNIDIDKAAFFLWWCGICNESHVNVAKFSCAAGMPKSEGSKSDNSSDNICPICFEEKDNIQLIPHWEAKGDVSGHRMCADCTEQYTKNECPFCNEVSIKESLLEVIKSLIQDVKSKSAGGDPNDLAAILESWQFFEMEYGHNPKVIYRVGALILQDKEFKNLLEDGVNTRAAWMRDAAGIFFRLYSLSVEGNLDVTPNEKILLQKCFETIKESMSSVKSQGHHYGALYSQSMVPYICALQSGQSTVHLEIIVREVGELIVRYYKKNRRTWPQLKRDVPERIVSEYMDIVTVNVWGGKDHDPVRKAFYRN